MAKKKWNWRHRVYIGTVLHSDYLDLQAFCAAKFGPSAERWDYSGQTRTSWSSGRIVTDTRVFFKSQDDLVEFKLSYTKPEYEND